MDTEAHTMQIDTAALAAFVLDTCDCHEAYEADEFVVDVEGQRFYVERKRKWFVLHVGNERIRLPRC